MFDIVVIGGGPGGYVAAIKGAQLGAKVALVENRRVGGCCLNRGCIPTKALVRTAEVYLDMKRGPEFGLTPGEVKVDWGTVIARKSKVVHQLTSGVDLLLKSNGVAVYDGTAGVPKVGLVEVALKDGGKETLETKNIIIATGSLEQFPPIPEEQVKAHTVTSEDALDFDHVPESLLIIGGGVLGIEFACIYNAFGSKIQVVKRGPGILPPIDEELQIRMIPMLKRKGITINHGIYIKEIKESGNGLKKLVADTKDAGPVEFEAEKILLALGRVPNYGGIDLDALGVERDKRGIKANAKMQTNVPGIYAIGDVVGRFWLAPVASAEGVVAVENITGHPTEVDYSIVPSCVFSIPEVATVGLKEKEARDQGLNIKVSKFQFTANGRAMAMGENEGVVKVVAKADDGKLLGVHILGPRATDLIHEASIALKMGAKAQDIADILVHAHPTLSEAFMEACEGVMGESIHIAPRRRAQ
ncbi:MAG TPA: dihydrolipoyl dehydrogenase [Bacillota bacterium]